MSQRMRVRLNVLSWVSPLIAVLVLAFLFSSSIGHTQDQAPIVTDARAKSFLGSGRSSTAQQLICTISSFFSVDSTEQVSENVHIEGRGLAICRNDQGFTTDVPVSMAIIAKAIGNWANAGAISFSGNSSSFVIPREVAQMQDAYAAKLFASDLSDKSAPSILFGGERHDLMIEMKFSSSTSAFQLIEIASMKIHFDESAPTLQ